MLLFAGFDPGAKNHIRPLFEYALHVGHKAQFIDLARLEEVDENWARSYLAGQQVGLLVAGSSGNQAELPLFKAHKRTGGKTVYIVEIGLGGRLDGVDYEDFPDHLLVTNENCADELVAIGVPEYRVHITGSTHLEAISKRNWTGAQHALRNYMRIRPDQIVASFCTSPSDLAMQAVKSLIELFRQKGWPNIALIVRPHPRTSKQQMTDLAEISRVADFVYLDAECNLDTPFFLAGSDFSLTMGSTTSLESIVLHTPSAIFQVDWDYAEYEWVYKNLTTVPRLRSTAEFVQFVEDAISGQFVGSAGNIENYQGALQRSWDVISELLVE
jgi:hypothetical protein